MDNNISLEKLIKYLGEPERKYGNEYQWQCPYCKDSHRDNLKFNIEKNILWCFANPEHSKQVLRDMAKNYKINQINLNKENKEKPKMENFIEYVEKCNKNILNSNNFIDFIYKHRGISKETIEVVKLGFDMEKRLFVIPNIKYTTDNEIFVFSMEYRNKIKSENKKVTREKNTPTGLTMINTYNSETEALLVVEGVWDGYVLYDFLKEKGQEKYYHIVSPSNGATTICNQFSEIEFSKYRKFYLYLDNDDAGNAATAKILEKYSGLKSKIKIIRTNCSCKDFNEHLMNCIRKCA